MPQTSTSRRSPSREREKTSRRNLYRSYSQSSQSSDGRQDRCKQPQRHRDDVGSKPSRSTKPSRRKDSRSRERRPHRDDKHEKRRRRSHSRSDGSPTGRSKRRYKEDSENGDNRDRGAHHKSSKYSSSRRRSASRSRSPAHRSRRHGSNHAPSHQNPPSSRGPGNSYEYRAGEDDYPPPATMPDKEQPNFGRSGKLAADTNTVAGTKIALKYHEPPEARLPPSSHDWRMYEFKDKETLNTIPLSTRSCWLVGREVAIADFAVGHPSCSAQHAVLQFRHVQKKNEYGDRIGKVRLYVLDLESSNGTALNGERIEDSRFVEVRSGDVLKFGQSTREYVILMA